MNDFLIEIAFKKIPKNRIAKLLANCTAQGREILSYSITCGTEDFNWQDTNSIEDVFTANKEFGLFINLKRLKTPYVCLQKCGIAVYKNAEEINLEFNFQFLDLYSTDYLTEKLMNFAESIASRYDTGEYYCGLEPAEETSTQLFTNQSIGPFSLKHLS